MNVSDLLEELKDYMDMYGDQKLIIHHQETGEELDITEFDDTFSDKFFIGVKDKWGDEK